MKKTIKTAMAMMAIMTCGAASAQYTNSGYFLENYTYGFQLNPAFGNQDNFVSMPVLGNINVSMRGNLHLTDVFYNVDGKTVLFTNPGVPESAVDKFSRKNRLSTNEKIDFMSGGFKAWGGYNTVSIGLRTSANVNVPKEFVELVKEGVVNDTYDIRNLAANASAYAQIAFNHSRDIPEAPGLRIGGTFKFYVGGGNVDAYFNRAELQLGENSWNGITNADIYTSVRGMKFKKKFNEHTGRDYVDGVDYKYGGLNGFGLGFDFGAQYKWRDFDFSLAVLDLGFITWGKTHWASTNGDREIQTDSYTFNVNGDAPNSFKNEWRRFRDDLSDLYQLEENTPMYSRTTGVGATLNVGVGYTLPYYRKLKFGLLSSTVINGRYTWTQARLSANVAPINWFSATANLECGTYGIGFGWMANFYHKGINVFIGMDHTPGKLAKQGVPLNSNAAVNFGINFPF